MHAYRVYVIGVAAYTVTPSAVLHGNAAYTVTPSAVLHGTTPYTVTAPCYMVTHHIQLQRRVTW